jgi:hypothetical protein
MDRMNRALLLCSLIGLACGGGFSSARAGMLGGDSSSTSSASLTALSPDYSHSTLVQGSAANVMAIDVTSAGQLQLTLTDLDFPNPFASIDLGLTDSNASLGSLAAPGTYTVDLTKPVMLYAEVFAVAGAATDVGLYNLSARLLTASPVPLPPTRGLLAIALALLVLMLRLCEGRIDTAVGIGAREPAV